MQEPLLAAPEKNAIEATVSIRCPAEEVFSFYRDFRDLPSFLGDVMTVEPVGPTTSRWTIQVLLAFDLHSSKVAELHHDYKERALP